MTLKQYKKVKIFIVIVLAMFFSQALYLKNYYIPIAVLVAASLLMMWLRRQVKEVVADERDYAVAGKAALLAIQIFGWCAAVMMFVFYGLRETNPAFEPIGMTLAYSTCILMLLYSLIFRYYEKIKLTDKKVIYLFVVLVTFFILFVVGARLFSGEDNWICVNGSWQKHGNPSFPAPVSECK